MSDDDEPPEEHDAWLLIAASVLVTVVSMALLAWVALRW